MFLTKLHKILPFSKWRNQSKSNKISTSCMLDANNLARSNELDIRL